MDWTSWSDLIDREHDDNEQETPTTKTEAFAFASRSKAKAKTRRPSTACSSSGTVPILERISMDIEQGAHSDRAYPMAKRINTVLRHGELLREEDGAIDFWRLKDDLQNKLDTALWLHLYVPKEESFPIPLKYIDVTRTTHTNLDALQEKRINGYWNVDMDRTWPDSWTGFTKFTLLNEKISRMYVVWRATYTNSSNYQTWLFVAWDFELAFQKQLKRKKELAMEKAKLDNVRRLRGIYFYWSGRWRA